MEPSTAFIFGKTLDGIAQSGAGKAGIFFGKEAQHERKIPLADLAEHPAYGLMYEVMGMGKEAARDAEGIIEFPGADKRRGRYYGDTLFPEIIARRETVKDFPVGTVTVRKRMKQPLSEDIRRREVHKVPVVGLPGMTEIELRDFPAVSWRRPRGSRLFISSTRRRKPQRRASCHGL